MAPGLSVMVRDGFVDGTGTMVASVMGLFNVVSAEGTPELAAGALHRYLAEAAWCPTSLLPSQGVKWNSIDDSTACATLSAAGTTVSLDFRFSDDGLRKRLRPCEPEGRDVFERVEESRLSAAALQEFEGRYESDELDAVFEVRVDGEGLALRRPNQDWVGMSPGIQDEFEAGVLGLTFVREGDAVSGLRVYAVRVTGIVFQRTGR
jgi:hypothetical protein